MIAANYSLFCENMKEYMDKVAGDEIVTVIRKDNKNVVLISEEAYNNLLENIYIVSNKSNFKWLMDSKAQYEKGAQ